MRNLFIALFILLTILNFIVYTQSPERMASHFGPGGRPDGWISKEAHFYLMQGMETFLLLLFLFIPELMVRTPVRWVNLPNREFWFAPENRSLLKEKLNVLMPEMGVYLFLFFGGLNLLILRANRSPRFTALTPCLRRWC